MTTPRLSVITAVRNGQAHLEAAIESILSQTFRDFEYLIVDDCSDDATPEILARFAKQDDRIRIIRNDENKGPYPSANTALELAQAPLIARMDGDDISAPERFERQVAFLDANPDHILVGSGYRSIDGAGDERFVKVNPLNDAAFRWLACFRMPIVHPSFCYRAKLPNGQPVRYRESFPVTQDYALACDLVSQGKAASIADPLVDYRMHSGNISTTRNDDQNTATIQIALRQLTREFSPEEAERFEPFLKILYAKRDRDISGFAQSAKAFRESVALDQNDDYRKWKTRRAAGMLAEAFLKGQPKSRQIKWALIFALNAPSMLPHLLARMLEVKGWISQDPTTL